MTSHRPRDSLYVYQQDVDLTSEVSAYSGFRRKGKETGFAHAARGVASSTECCVLRVANFKCWKWLKFPVSDFSLADWQHLSDVWIITRLWCFLLVKMFSSTLKLNKLATQFMLQTWATELFIFFLVVFEFYKWIWWQLSLALVWCCDIIGGCCFCWSSWQLTNTSKRILKQHWYWLLLFLLFELFYAKLIYTWLSLSWLWYSLRIFLNQTLN